MAISTQDSPVRSSTMADNNNISSSSFLEAGQSKNNAPPQSESGLELVVDSAGKAVLVGDDDDFDVERDDGLYNNNNNMLKLSTAHTKQQQRGGCCPVWLRNSSPKMKGFLSIATIAFLASAVVLILGVLQLFAPTWNNGTIESDKNSVTTTGGAINAPASTDMSVVNIRLSDDLEVKVPNNFNDELTPAQMEDWNIVIESIESAISTSLLSMLPTGYTVKSVQVDKFDEHTVGSQTRHLQDNIAIIHAVQYSSAITANCTIADCSVAATAVANASTELYETVLDVSSNDSSEVSLETEVTNSPAVSTVTTISPTMSVTIAPTVNPVSEPPTSSAPTTMLVLSDVVQGCSEVMPCGLCNGGCVDDDGCEEGLFCFRRIGYDTVPGCLGPGIYALSYCYNPFVFGLTETELLLDEQECDREKDRQCEKCRGECSDDDDCKDGLFCYRRFGFEQVPGCTGQVCYPYESCVSMLFFPPCLIVSACPLPK